MTFSISFSKKETGKADTFVVGIYEDNALSAAAKELDSKQAGLISGHLKGNKTFKGKNGQILSLTLNQKKPSRIILLGLGKKDKLDNIAFETLGGKLYGTLKSGGAENVDIHLEGIEDIKETSTAEIAAHLALGLKLKSYNFDKYKSKKDEESAELSQITIVTDANSAATKLYDKYSAVSEGVFLARDLVNEAPNALYPESYAEIIKQELKPLGVEVEVLGESKLQKLGFGALLAVGQGSARESKVVVMRWNGSGKTKKNGKAPIAFVGKGVTFDTGGISLKPGAEMDLMKMDMGGSAAVVGMMKAVAARKAKANVIGIVGLVENMPSDRAYRPGDILKSLSGKTIEVLNTDAEGRLVLADVLTYVQKTYKPEVIIDLATLTGAIMVALGFEYCGAFANDDRLWEQIQQASKNTGEKFWRMPLDEAYRKEMESEVADLKNLGSLGRYGGACSAAGFLEHFIEEGTKWAHIDIAGTAWWKSDKPTTPKGGTGFAVRALNDLVEKHFEK
ncbi:MAG TPA: leucyl aminopeptidase [Alphaproteobacteria bacterium]|nr:leucyl aminopeptidase [Alphaproteobacteria bacterium]